MSRAERTGAPPGAARHLSHWGAFSAAPAGDGRLEIAPHPDDPSPSPLLANLADGALHATRVRAPAVRRGWLERGPGAAPRGAEPFVEVSWPEALDLLARELRRVIDARGNEAIFAGSYGWASAGCFHHAQSQLHRFLNCIGGYTRSRHTYSFGASEVILPHVVGDALGVLTAASTWSTLAQHGELVVSFGGIPLKNTAVNGGGVARHRASERLREVRARGVRFVLFSPLRDDLAAELGAQWCPLRPGSDVAVMLALAHVLVEEGLADRAFVDRYTVGFDRFERYLGGAADGVAKTPEWAAPLCGLPADSLRALARQMAASRTLITVTWSLQRAEHGEQPIWAAIALAALLGQIGLPGGGFGHGYGAIASVGEPPVTIGPPSLPQGDNPVASFIPVARIADLLLHPGEPFDYDGQRLVYPDIRLVWWAGGNPFHHHQDLNRLRRAWARPDTIVVNEPFWTATARHADFVLPVTTTLERDDLGGGHNDPRLTLMEAVVAPLGEARSDYAIFSDLAARLGVGERFTEGRDERAWLEHLYEAWRARAAGAGFHAPPYAEFRAQGAIDLPRAADDWTLFAAFRADPAANPLRTPSGRIELYSQAIAAFGYDDCPGHPAWQEPAEWGLSPAAARFPLTLIANNPATRLHSQLDAGATSRASKVAGREPARMHPDDMAARGIAPGDVVRLYNDRGSCLAGVVASDAVRPGVVQLSTGAWFDPDDPAAELAMCRHGNPNVLTGDRGTSRLAQGSTGQRALVQVERWPGEAPAVRTLEPPEIIRRG